jgi:hypothetical protein
MVRYTKYKKEYNKAEFTGDYRINKKLQNEEKEVVEVNDKIIVKVRNFNSSKVLKNMRGYEIRQRENRDKFNKAKIICLRCRKPGHKMSVCTQQAAVSNISDDKKICYKCGAKEHSLANCPNKEGQESEDLPFAKCFICGENGHLSGTCVKNERGKYPKGGACKICGDVRHFGKDCPLKAKKGHQLKGEEKIFSEDEQERQESIQTPTGLKLNKQKQIKVVEFK